MEGSRLTHDQTRYIFETNTIGVENEVLNVDDVIETVNHFRCIDMIIDHAKSALTEKFIKELHLILKSGTSDSRKDWFAVGDYKKLPNEVGGMDTTLPEEVSDKMKALLKEYTPSIKFNCQHLRHKFRVCAESPVQNKAENRENFEELPFGDKRRAVQVTRIICQKDLRNGT